MAIPRSELPTVHGKAARLTLRGRRAVVCEMLLSCPVKSSDVQTLMGLFLS